MTTVLASAHPRKSFFIDMFTRDLSLDDAILDMIDNSIDGMARTFAPDMFREISERQEPTVGRRKTIKIAISKRAITITDNCGGIPFSMARDEIFNFGHSPNFRPETEGQLGVYGVGLKRAAFKIARRVRVVSRSESDGFSMDWDIEAWGRHDGSLEDWSIPIRRVGGVRSSASRGTTIRLEKLRPEVVAILERAEFRKRLHERVATTYTWFLGKYVDIKLDGVEVQPFRIPLGESEVLKLGRDRFQADGAEVRLWAGMSGAGAKGHEERLAGWYVMCNGRVVVAADKSDLTGWGNGGAVQWHAKYRSFVGLAFFLAVDPLRLPWTTTKRGLHRESPAYVQTLDNMRSLARPVLHFIATQYEEDPEPSAFARRLTQDVRAVDVRALPSDSVAFMPPLSPRRREVGMTRVTLSIPEARIALARKHLGNPELKGRDVVLGAFDAYLGMMGA